MTSQGRSWKGRGETKKYRNGNVSWNERKFRLVKGKQVSRQLLHDGTSFMRYTMTEYSPADKRKPEYALCQINAHLDDQQPQSTEIYPGGTRIGDEGQNSLSHEPMQQFCFGAAGGSSRNPVMNYNMSYLEESLRDLSRHFRLNVIRKVLSDLEKEHAASANEHRDAEPASNLSKRRRCCTDMNTSKEREEQAQDQVELLQSQNEYSSHLGNCSDDNVAQHDQIMSNNETMESCERHPLEEQLNSLLLMGSSSRSGTSDVPDSDTDGLDDIHLEDITLEENTDWVDDQLSQSNLDGQIPANLPHNINGNVLEPTRHSHHQGNCTNMNITEHGLRTGNDETMSTGPSDENPLNEKMDSPSPMIAISFGGAYNSLDGDPGHTSDNFFSMENTQSYQMFGPNATLPESNDLSHHGFNKNHGEPYSNHYLGFHQNITEPSPSTIPEVTCYSNLLSERYSPGGSYYPNRDPGIPIGSLFPDENTSDSWWNMCSSPHTSAPIGHWINADQSSHNPL